MDNVDNLVVVCTDGSEASIAALRAGLRVVGEAITPVIVTAAEPPDPLLLTGGGHAGPVVDAAEYQAVLSATRQQAADTLAATATQLDRPSARTEILEGSAGPAICAFADEVGAHAIVIGTRGRGGIKRALLGSVSDHVVRNASCPVVVGRPDTD